VIVEEQEEHLGGVDVDREPSSRVSSNITCIAFMAAYFAFEGCCGEHLRWP
jgi:hypothetical protein